MRGRKILPILLVIVLLAGTIYFVLPPVQAYTTNIGISYVGASHELPLRQEQGPETVIVNAYSEGTDYVERTFTVSIYYYTTATPGTLIGTQDFTLKSSASVPRNETAKAVSWDISAIPEDTYKFYAAITAGLPGGDENAADNTRTSLQNPSWRQRMLGIIAAGGHNVGVGIVQGSFPNIIKAGTTYSISISAFNNGYVAESPVTVTTYYNRSSAPTTFVSINVTTIPSLAAKTGTQSWSVTWDTTGLPEDEYSLSSNATVVSGETITYEQFDYTDQQVTVIQHDIAVLDVNAYPTGQTPGGLVTINMTVENQGAVTETFTVRMKANATEIASSPKTVTDLASGAHTSVFFSWNPAGTGFYILNGSADFVAGEAHERADNVYRNEDIRRRVNVPAIHNVATTFVSTNATYAKPGDQVSIFAVVQNRGDYDESFSVTPYYDGTQAAAPQTAVISKRADTGEPYGQANMQFVWDTTGVALGTYYIKVAAAVVSGETYTSDNNYTDGRVIFTKVYINPARSVVDQASANTVRPTANTVTGTIVVSNPGNAYDNNEASYASFYTSYSTSNYIEFHTFSTPPLATQVARVDVNIRYSAASVAYDTLRVIQGVSPSSSWYTLRDWSAATVAATNATFADRPEPNDGSWSLADVANLNVRFEYNELFAGENPTNLRFYDVYAKINSSAGTFIRRPTTSSTSGSLVVTTPALAYDGLASSYAYVSTFASGNFTVGTFDNSGISGTIYHVDLIIKYSISSNVDRFSMYDRIGTGGSTRYLRQNIYSDVNVPLGNYVFTNRAEPVGGWTWTNVGTIRIRFTPQIAGVADNREVRIYEIWLTVYDKPFSATYNAGGVTGMNAWTANITWDPTKMDLTSASSAGFFTGYTTTFTQSIDHAGGYAVLSEYILGTGSKSGSGALANLVFILIGDKGIVTPTKTFLVDTTGVNMAHYEEVGKFRIAGALLGDFNGDGAVDATDISMFNQHYGKKLGDAGYDDIYDLYDDNVINAKDLRLIGKNYW